MYESEGGDKDCDMPSSGHGLAVTHMNSQQQWLPAQYLCKMNPIKFHMDWGETPETLPLSEEILSTEGRWMMSSYFSLGPWPLIGYPFPSG